MRREGPAWKHALPKSIHWHVTPFQSRPRTRKRYSSLFPQETFNWYAQNASRCTSAMRWILSQTILFFFFRRGNQGMWSEEGSLKDSFGRTWHVSGRIALVKNTLSTLCWRPLHFGTTTLHANRGKWAMKRSKLAYKINQDSMVQWHGASAQVKFGRLPVMKRPSPENPEEQK